ncbi:hypothetical protein RUM44_003651 [Polyplax serrata]|uniref:Uncharacterized protein n=1 Tax=Polyplax serrata TaxID=468196 RepID=A0ABR1AIJ3_POLSC
MEFQVESSQIQIQHGTRVPPRNEISINWLPARATGTPWACPEGPTRNVCLTAPHWTTHTEIDVGNHVLSYVTPSAVAPHGLCAWALSPSLSLLSQSPNSASSAFCVSHPSNGFGRRVSGVSILVFVPVFVCVCVYVMGYPGYPSST